MKRFLLSIPMLLCLRIANSQDIIIKKNGDEVKSKVEEITEATIKYKKWENMDGPVYNIDKADVFKVKYENGQSDFFGEYQAKNNTGFPLPIVQKSTSQQIKSYPLPPSLNIPYYYNKATNNLTELERVSFTNTKQHSGIWGRITVIAIPGISSNVRFSTNASFQFLIHLDEKTNPSAICELKQCAIKNQREFIDIKQGMHGAEKQPTINLQFQKISDGFYLILIPENILKGEYFFQIMNQPEAYAFGYDK